jgi:hypothetical protein
MLFATVLPNRAMARKGTYVPPDAACSSCISAGGGTHVKSVRVSQNASASSGVGWSCRLKKDGYDEHRVVQNKASRKNTETFLENSWMGAGAQAASAILGGNPLSLIGLLQTAFSFGNNSDNLTDQQKLACEKLELHIKNIKEQKAAIADIGKKSTEQINGVALDLGKKVDERVKSQFDARINAVKSAWKAEVREEVIQELVEIGRRQGLGNGASPEAKPEVPEKKSAPLYGPEIPSVQAPMPKPVVPSTKEAVPMPTPAIKPREELVTAKPLQKQAKRER